MNIKSKLGIRLLCATSVLAINSVAHAQDNAASVETVVVTGSLVITNIANSPTPITAISTNQLATISPIDVPDALNELPIFLGGTGPADTNNAAEGAIGNVLNLRDFGAQRTLVLFDGHRQAPSNSNGTVDIDTLPQAIMQRVDIVTGGASAVYGSDAVSGAVNFVIDKKFDGLAINANAGISSWGDGAEQQFTATAGTDLFQGRGHLEGSFKYGHLDPILLSARPWGPSTSWEVEGSGTAASPLTNVIHTTFDSFAYGGKITCTGCAANGEQFVSNGVIGPFNLGTPTASTSFTSGGDGTTTQAASLQESQIVYQDFDRFSYDINDNMTFYVQGIAAQGYTSGYHVQNYIQTGTSANLVFSNNAFLSPANQALLANSKTGAVQMFTDTQYFQYPDYLGDLDRNINRNLSIQTGLDGTIFDKFNWDLYYSHSQDRLKSDQPYDESNAKIMAAMDAVTNSSGQIVCEVSLTTFANLYPGCVPLNRFGPTSATTTQYNYILFDDAHVTTQTLDDFSGSVSGDVFDLPAGPLKAAIDGEYRENTYLVNSNAPAGTVDCTGLRLCVTGIAQSQHGVTLSVPSESENVWEFAGEIDAPLLKDMPLVQTLDLNLAGRYTDYSISGPVETWKIGADYHVNDDVHFRATTSVDIRAPTLSDLFSPSTIGHTGFTDLHTGNTGGQVTTISQGNPNLIPEVGRTYTGGVVLTPTFIPGLTFSADYYQIKVANAIVSLNGTTAGVQQVCEASGNTSPLCALFVRPLPFSDHTTANYPTEVLSEVINAALNDTDGVDFELDYKFDMADVWDGAPGSLALRTLANYQPANNTASFPGAPITQAVEPKGRFTNVVTYDLGSWTFGLTDRFYTKYNKSTQPGVLIYAEPYGKSLNYIDLNVDKKTDIDGNSVDWYFNIKNVINTAPPIEPDNATVPAESPYGGHLSAGGSVGGLDPVGRYFTVGVRFSP